MSFFLAGKILTSVVFALLPFGIASLAIPMWRDGKRREDKHLQRMAAVWPALGVGWACISLFILALMWER